MKTVKKNNLPQTSFKLLVVILALSAMIHLVTVYEVSRLSEDSAKPKKQRLQIKLVDKAKKKVPTKDKPKTNDDAKKILEVHQEETEAPKVANHKGHQNHKAAKETRVKPTPKQPAMDPGKAGANQQTKTAGKTKKTPKKVAKKPVKQTKNQKTTENKPTPPKLKPKLSMQPLLSPKGKKSFSQRAHKTKDAPPPGSYQSFLPSGDDLAHQVRAGYQDYVDESLELGDKIDINTTDYRYIGYFTSMRKAIELVWTYPSAAARRGHQGIVGLQFTILKDGQINGLKVVSSSGYQSLDTSIVEAIRLASPFSPLPDGFGKNELTITGNFRYMLNNFASGH